MYILVLVFCLFVKGKYIFTGFLVVVVWWRLVVCLWAGRRNEVCMLFYFYLMAKNGFFFLDYSIWVCVCVVVVVDFWDGEVVLKRNYVLHYLNGFDRFSLIGGGTQRASRKKLNYLAGQYNQAKNWKLTKMTNSVCWNIYKIGFDDVTLTSGGEIRWSLLISCPTNGGSAGVFSNSKQNLTTSRHFRSYIFQMLFGEVLVKCSGVVIKRSNLTLIVANCISHI